MGVVNACCANKQETIALLGVILLLAIISFVIIA